MWLFLSFSAFQTWRFSTVLNRVYYKWNRKVKIYRKWKKSISENCLTCEKLKRNSEYARYVSGRASPIALAFSVAKFHLEREEDTTRSWRGCCLGNYANNWTSCSRMQLPRRDQGIDMRWGKWQINANKCCKRFFWSVEINTRSKFTISCQYKLNNCKKKKYQKNTTTTTITATANGSLLVGQERDGMERHSNNCRTSVRATQWQKTIAISIRNISIST